MDADAKAGVDNPRRLYYLRHPVFVVAIVAIPVAGGAPMVLVGLSRPRRRWIGAAMLALAAAYVGWDDGTWMAALCFLLALAFWSVLWSVFDQRYGRDWPERIRRTVQTCRWSSMAASG